MRSGNVAKVGPRGPAERRSDEKGGTVDRKVRLTRRSFLENAALVAACGVGEGEARADDGCPSPPNDYVRGGALTGREWRAVTLAAQALLPQPLPGSGPTLDEVVANLQRFVENADPRTLAGFRQQLALLGTLAALVAGDLPALSRDLEALLLQRDQTPIKAALDQLHKVVVLGYYSLPKAGALIGYTRPSVVPLYRRCLPTRSRPTSRLFDVAIVGAG